MRKGFLYLFTFAIIILSLASCTATKYVPDGSYLLDEVKIHTDQKNVRPSSLRMYVRQNPNAKWFSLIKTQLYVYNLSGRDSTKWGNKFLRRIGDAPVIYSETEAQRSQDAQSIFFHSFFTDTDTPYDLILEIFLSVKGIHKTMIRVISHSVNSKITTA